MEVNVQEDLNAVNDQLQKLVEELNKVSNARENLVQQVQNLNGVAMYLRGKLPPEEQVPEGLETPPESETADLDRSIEYPEE
tara:strand:- start:5599 stop:5844 length:246 start_codon:yes stop_codon:yes gene_type:complete